jgi:3-hydroxyacyl-CoA dehydrogenase
MSSEQSDGGVTVEIIGGDSPVAIVTVDFPPLNIGSHAMRLALFNALGEFATRNDVKGAVLVGGGANFVAGSDVREFDAPPLAPHLPDVIERIEQLPFPVVAAIRGAALGGGCELALGCDWRVASPDAILGLPEATLGLVPGAGGTVRMPRLVGAIVAVDLVSSGRRLSADQACKLGLVDAVAEGDLVSAARTWLATHPEKRLAKHLVAPSSDRAALEKAVAEVRRKARGAEAPPAAAEAVLRGLDMEDPDQALALERADSLRLRVSEQSKALRYLFQAERRAGRPPRGVETMSIKRVGVVGAGRMGSDIAFVFARAGLEVKIVEANAEVVTRALSQIAQNADRLVRRGEIADAKELSARVTVVPLEGLADCQLVVEAIPELLEAKQSLLMSLAALVPAETILATNTSYLDIDVMAEPVPAPERVVGLHFFNPASVLKLVEVVRARRTSPEVVATMLRLARRLDKLPVLANVGEGFIGNRIFAAYRRVCEYLLEDGCLPQQVDRAMVDFGMAMGPFAVFDLAGLDIAWAMRKRLAATRDASERYVTIPDTLCEEGRFGRNVAKGWYDYVDGKPVPSAHVTSVIEAASLEKGRERRVFSDSDIVSLLVTAMANEAAHAVHEGVAVQLEDADVAFCNGFGFPRHRGGPLYWAAQQDAAVRQDLAERVATMSGRPIAPNFQSVLDTISKSMTKLEKTI